MSLKYIFDIRCTQELDNFPVLGHAKTVIHAEDTQEIQGLSKMLLNSRKDLVTEFTARNRNCKFINLLEKELSFVVDCAGVEARLVGRTGETKVVEYLVDQLCPETWQLMVPLEYLLNK